MNLSHAPLKIRPPTADRRPPPIFMRTLVNALRLWGILPSSNSLRPWARTWLLRPSVRVKIMGIVLGLVLLLGFGITYQVRVTTTAQLTAQLEERGISIARDLAARATDLILIHNTYALHELVRDTLANNRDVRYALILDAQGRVLVHSFESGLPRHLLSQNRVAPNERVHVATFSSDEGPIHDFAVPIFDGRAGVARVGLTHHSVRRAVDTLTGQMLLTTFGVSVIGIGAAYLLTLVLTHPIRVLVQVTQAVARGDLTQQAPLWGEDEIGQLSTAFNRMTRELAQAQANMLRRNRELAALNAVAMAMNTPAPLAQSLDRSLRALLDALALDAGWVLLFDRSGERIQLSSWVGLPSELAARELAVALRDCPCALAVQEQRAHVVASLPPHCPLREARLKDQRAVGSHVTVPILARGHVLGVFGVASAETQAFNAEEVKLLQAVGQQLGVAVENARLWDDLRDKERVRRQLLEKIITAQEEERKRIARELHDDTGQALTSLMVGLRAANDALAVQNDHATARARLSELREIAAQTLEAVKRLARELRPPLLDDLGLAAALERYVANYQANFGLRVDLETSGLRQEERLPPTVELTLYRVIQEALTNIVKHAHAQNVSLVVERKADKLIAIVEDDGCGFDVRAVVEATAEEGKLGLHGMRERIELVGGRLQFESAPGAGTSVFVEIPLER